MALRHFTDKAFHQQNFKFNSPGAGFSLFELTYIYCLDRRGKLMCNKKTPLLIFEIVLIYFRVVELSHCQSKFVTSKI